MADFRIWEPLSGTRTLYSGLVHAVYGGNQWASASAGFVVTIRNCTIEEGVTIGYSGKESKIGSFVNKLNGAIENCTSYATVNGKDYVGGIIGTMDNAMGTCVVKNSVFHGTVNASGNYAGGIVGGGYSNDNSAPNGKRPSIASCTVDGTVQGTIGVEEETDGPEAELRYIIRELESTANVGPEKIEMGGLHGVWSWHSSDPVDYAEYRFYLAGEGANQTEFLLLFATKEKMPDLENVKKWVKAFDIRKEN